MDRGRKSPLLTWLLAPVSVALVLSALSLARQPYTGLSLRGEWVAAVQPGSPAARAGLAPGDRLIAPAGSARLLQTPLARAVPGVELPVLRERAGSLVAIRLVPAALPDGERRMMAALLAVASGWVLLGGWVWSERRDRLTRTFFLLCLAFAWMLAPLPHFRSSLAQACYEALYTAASVLLPALFIHFFALFPESGRPPGRLRSLTSVAYGVAVGLALASLGSMAWSLAIRRPAVPAQALLQGVAGLWFALGLLVALLVFARSYRRARSQDARRRLRVALVGTALGALPLAALVAVRNLLPGGQLPGERVAVLLTLLVPASFAWAIAVHHVFEFRAALRAGVVLTTLAVLGGLVYALGEWLGAAWRPDLGAGITGGAIAFLALTASVAGPAGRALRSLGGRVVRDEQPALERLDASPAARAGTSEQLLAATCIALVDAYHLDGCTAVELDSGGLRAVARTGVAPAPALHPEACAALPPPGRLAALEMLTLKAVDRRALERGGVSWILAVGEAPRRFLLLGRRLGGSWLAVEEQRDLRRLAGHLEVLLENARLREAASARGQIDRELSRAGAIQSRLLPRRIPVFRSLDCAAAALSSEAVGGDCYDFVRGPGRVLTLAVGDAAGKGVPAALLSAWVQSGFRGQARQSPGPEAILTALNRELVGMDQPQAFVALLCARVDVPRGRFVFANAGQPPPLVRRRGGGFEELPSGGVLLGVRHEATYREAAADLETGDIVVLYTDGLTEARRGDELFGIEGVKRVVEAQSRAAAGELIKALLKAVQDWADHPMDDVTVVVLKQLTRPIRALSGPLGDGLKSGAIPADTTT